MADLIPAPKRKWRKPQVIDVGNVADVTDGADGNVRDNYPDVPAFFQEPFVPVPKSIDGEVDLGDK